MRRSRRMLFLVWCMPLATACRVASDARVPRADSPTVQAVAPTALRAADSVVTERVDSASRAAAPAVDTSARVRITRDSLGDVPLWVPLGELARRVPGAERSMWYGYEVGYPALEFTVGGLHVFAVQEVETEDDSMPRLDLARPADFYQIRGATGRLPGGVTTGSSWAELRRALRPVFVRAVEVYAFYAGSCAHDWFTLDFAPPRDLDPRKHGDVDPDLIDPTARPLSMQIIRPAIDSSAPRRPCVGS